MKKRVLRTSFRSATQATDSTWTGWSANSAATKALRHRAPVIMSSSRNRSTVLAMWKATLVKWWPRGFRPNSWQSAIWESQVSGCQFPISKVVKAHLTLSTVSPVRTCGFAVTYCTSS